MAKAEGQKAELDPSDGMLRSIVGSWSLEKHKLLCRYVGTSRAARQKWSDRHPSFIDLYCGLGRSRIEPGNKVIDGGVLAAAKEAQKGAPFHQLIVADLESEHVDICQRRLAFAGFSNVRAMYGRAEDTAGQAVALCDKKALHLAYLDPYSIHALPFSVIETIGSGLDRADLFIHFSVMDFRRNLVLMQSNGRLDEFAPGWQNVVQSRLAVDALRIAIFRYWLGLIRNLGYNISGHIVRVAGVRTADYYWLILASRHPIADRFWKVAANEPQGELEF